MAYKAFLYGFSNFRIFIFSNFHILCTGLEVSWNRNCSKKEKKKGSTLAVQCLGLSLFTARAWFRLLVGGLRYHRPRGAADQ